MPPVNGLTCNTVAPPTVKETLLSGGIITPSFQEDIVALAMATAAVLLASAAPPRATVMSSFSVSISIPVTPSGNGIVPAVVPDKVNLANLELFVKSGSGAVTVKFLGCKGSAVYVPIFLNKETIIYYFRLNFRNFAPQWPFATRIL